MHSQPASGFLRVLATDFDGTLADPPAGPAPGVVARLDAFRESGGLVLLVTGRILTELHKVFPDFPAHMDAVVGENGAVLWQPSGTTRLADPVDAELLNAGRSLRPGQVILAGDAADRLAVLEGIRRRGLDCQLSFNRSEMMVVPAGVNKGSGLSEAMAELGISRHSAVGVGDAENDRALLDSCEVGVAVANAVPALSSFADLRLGEPDGGGVSRVADLIRAGTPLHSRRRRLNLGVMAYGATASVPSSQFAMLLVGEPGSGKSHLLGLCAEQLISLGYCILVIDPEGDHGSLGQLRGAVSYDGASLPPPDHIVNHFSTRFSSVVLDLSEVPERHAAHYLERLADAVDASWRRFGLPHWIVADEAHAGTPLVGRPATGDPTWSTCLATYRPDWLAPATHFDAVVALTNGDAPDSATAALLSATGAAGTVFTTPGRAFLAQRVATGPSGTFDVGTRMTKHHRHLHKYVAGALPHHLRFVLRSGRDEVVGVVANLSELRDALITCHDSVIEHHAANTEMSRWLSDVLQDHVTAERVAGVEGALAQQAIGVPTARHALLEIFHDEYRL